MAINGTLELIDSVTVGSGGAASIEFTSIPQTYDDLVLKVSHRSSRTGGVITASLLMAFNGSSANFTGRRLQGSGSVASSASQTNNYFSNSTTESSTLNTFTSTEIYIPNYAGSTHKSISVDDAHENNTTEAYAYLWAGLWSQTAAINQITLTISGYSFVEHSTAYLYGVTRVPAGAKATGGVIYSDSNYWYHAFTSSGTFTPTQNLTADYLVVAGGGGAQVGGGGAGGYRNFTSQSLTSSTNYTVTIGAGGSGAVYNGSSTKGSNSVFGPNTATGGGQSGKTDTNPRDGYTGGSGGGGAGDGAVTSSGGAGNEGGYSPVEGYAGGGNGGNLGSPYYGGGGGGSGGAGGNASSIAVGAGGIGTTNSISGTSLTYAAGGSGGAAVGSSGNGASGSANTGNGGSGSQQTTTGVGGNGGSGIVIVRYAK